MTHQLVTSPGAAPCPGWCRHPAGHGHAFPDGTRRVHLSATVTVLGVGDVTITQVDTVHADGTVAPDPVIVRAGGRRIPLSVLLTVHDVTGRMVA